LWNLFFATFLYLKGLELVFERFKSSQHYKLSKIKTLLSILLNYFPSKHHGPSPNSQKFQIQAFLPFVVSRWSWVIFFITTV